MGNRKPQPIPKDLKLTEINPYTELTLKQKRYVEARLQGLNKAASKRAAGCGENGDMEQNPKVRAAIRYLVNESMINVEKLTKSDVLTGMMDAVSAAATASELVMAWREVGKLLGAYEPERKILEIRDYSAEELKTLSDTDLAKLAGGRMQNVIEDADFHEVPSKPAEIPEL